MKIKEFKCRASKIGDLMTNGKGKVPVMGDTAKNYLKEWVIEEITGHRKEIQSKYLTKGIEVEPLALERAGKLYGCEFNKNTERLANEFFTGEWDSKNDELVIDVKSSWDAFTFPYFIIEPPKGYYNQLQVYMDLTGLKKASLVYCLENATEDEIDRKAQKLAWEDGLEEPDMKHWDKASEMLTFDHLPDWMRIKRFEFKRNDHLIEAMKTRVEVARLYIKDDLIPTLENLKKCNESVFKSTFNDCLK